MNLDEMRACAACPLAATRRQVVCPVGPAKADIVLVGEAPGETEDKGGEPFTGAAGKKLNWLLKEAGVTRTDVVITNTVMCHPPGNRKPKAAEIKACRRWLAEVLREAHPRVVLTLGDFALKAVLGREYTLVKWHGRRVVSPETQGLLDEGVVVVPMYHPAVTLHNPGMAPVLIKDFQHLPDELGREDVGAPEYEVLDVALSSQIFWGVREFAFDLETSWVRDRVGDVGVVGWSAASPSWHHAYFVRELPKAIQGALSSLDVQVIAHNAQFEYQVLKELDITLRNVWDTKLAAYVLGYQDTSLKGLVLQVFGHQMERLEELSNNFKLGVEEIEPDVLARYGAADAWWTLKLKSLFEDELRISGLQSVFYDIELPLIPVLGDMMAAGIEVDKEALHQASVILGTMAGEKALYLKKILGDINLDSSAQIANVLFGKDYLNYPIIKSTKGGSRPSTEKEVLEKLARFEVQEHLTPVIQELLDYRHITKLQTTYTEGILERIGERTRLYAHFNQAGGFEDRGGGNLAEAPRTGRLSSSGPNLTNIPKHDAPGLSRIASLVRKCFVSRRGASLVVGDLSQEEFRVAAFLSQDPMMLGIIREGRDWHTETAEEAYGHSPTPEERYYGKQANFSKLNGAGAEKIAQVCKVPKEIGQLLSNGFDRRYKRYQQWRREEAKKIRETGYATTYYERRRYLPGVWAKSGQQQAEALRQGINVPIQGTAADILKLSMRRLWERLQGHDAQIVACVHDEIVVETLDKEIPFVIQCLHEMTTGLLGDMELPVEVKVGRNWAGKDAANLNGLVEAN